jgi:uncharacterized protein DUF4430
MASGSNQGGELPRRSWLLAWAAAAAIFAGLPIAANRAAAQAEPAASKTVELTIDYGDGVQKVFRELAWNEGMTVLDALEAAAKHPRGIKPAHRGSGATAFVTAIDDLKNEGSGRNWTYEVNGKKANKSCGVWTLEGGDRVVWRFAKYEG